MSEFEKDQVMQNRDLRILAAKSALVNYQEFLSEKAVKDSAKMSLDKYLNKITCGDCYELIKELPDKSVDCIYTDIPYLYANGGLGHNEMCVRTARKKEELKDISSGIDYAILEDFKRVLKKINIFIWCSKMQLLDIMNWGGRTIVT